MPNTHRVVQGILLVAASALLASCASGGGGGGQAPAPAQPGGTQASPRAASPWPLKTRLHVDLWLHGYAMIQDDTTIVPYFKRGYRDAMVATKARTNATTQLDANRDQLRARFAVNRNLVGAQFLPLYFDSWETLQRAMETFLQAEGNPQRASDQQTYAVIATFSQYFPTAPDREWLRMFANSLRDEHDRFYRAYWTQRQRELEPVLARIDTLWEDTYRPKLQRYLNNTQSGSGSFYLALPLDGEGRTITGTTREENVVTTAFPETREAATEAIFVFAHEVIGRVASTAVDDNTTPTEKRAGLSDRYASAAAVRGGALLLKRVAPELLDGYVRYYLRSANTAGGGGDEAALARAFPLPQGILDAINRQLDVVLGGI
ncbi:MAG: hypothetical protein WKG32_11370 [Gemmatimonadaceae bacterium]